MKRLVYLTIYISLFIQLITGILSFSGLFIKINKEDFALKEILGLELIVQVIEAIFYIWIIFALNNMNNMTPRRYIDWTITTPMMLLSTMVFMKFSQDKNTTLKSFINNNKLEVILVFLFNGLMLLFGYLGETNIINKYYSITIGFIFFFLNFRLIYENYAKYTKVGVNLFVFLIICWSLYGISAMLPIKIKNICYNLLDIISKNFYGLFIFYHILKVRKS